MRLVSAPPGISPSCASKWRRGAVRRSYFVCCTLGFSQCMLPATLMSYSPGPLGTRCARASRFTRSSMTSHRAVFILGTQSGWDRFIDSHVGLVYRRTWLDDYAPAMADGGVGFHAYLDAWESDSICLSHSKMEESCGSIWTEGVSGFGMEMHAFFDYSWFKDDKDPELLYCWQTCTREEY